jgi:hypothetical protein
MAIGENELSARKKERFSHVYISLVIKHNEESRIIRALDWNEIGFNFFLDEKLEEKELVFKKELKEFIGQVVWTFKNDDDSTILEMIINDMLLKHLEQHTEKNENLVRILKMVRSVGILDKKKELLSLFGIKLTINDIEKEIEFFKKENSLYRHGVEIESDDWKEICDQTLKNAPPEETTRPIDELINELSPSE